MTMETALGKYFCDLYSISLNDNCAVEYVNARDLIVPSRIDLCAKIAYVKNRIEGINCSFVDELYKEHISAFTVGSCSEAGNSEKNSIEDYINTFHELIENIKSDGVREELSVIPVGRGNGIMDGGHRVAIAAYLDLRIPIVRLEQLEPHNDLQFFRERLLEEKYLDYMAIEYCRLVNRDVYMAICWPSISASPDTAEEMIRARSNVIYKKNVALSSNGIRNFIIQTYIDCDWCGNMEKGFVGAQPQITGCYGSGGSLTAFLLEAEDIESIKAMKTEIRAQYGIGNYSIHSTDNAQETIKLAHLLFNNNSVDFMNIGHPDTYPSDFSRIDSYKRLILASGYSLDDFVIDSSSVLSIYGLRKAQDLDFLTAKTECMEMKGDSISCHNTHVLPYGVSITNSVYNPNFYFYFYDLKFMALSQVRNFKTNRAEKKDLDDVLLIDSVYKPDHIRMKLIRLRLLFKQKAQSMKYYSLLNIIKLCKRLHIYSFARAVYRIGAKRK